MIVKKELRDQTRNYYKQVADGHDNACWSSDPAVQASGYDNPQNRAVLVLNLIDMVDSLSDALVGIVISEE